jgi:arylsulfatase
VIVPIDVQGSGGPRTFGGPIRTEVLDRPAANGVRCNDIHATALSSPARAALQSDRRPLRQASTGSTASSATRPTRERRTGSTVSRGSNCRATRTTA